MENVIKDQADEDEERDCDLYGEGDLDFTVQGTGFKYNASAVALNTKKSDTSASKDKQFGIE